MGKPLIMCCGKLEIDGAFQVETLKYLLHRNLEQRLGSLLLVASSTVVCSK